MFLVIALRKDFDLYILEPHFISMVLKKDMTFFCSTEAWPHLVFAIVYKCVPHLIIAFIFKNLYMIKPMLDMVAVYLDRCSIEEASSISLVLRSRNKIVKGCKLSVAVDTFLRIRMVVVIQDLEFAAD